MFDRNCVLKTFLNLLRVNLSLIITAQNNVISPNFLIWKFCWSAQFRITNSSEHCGNCALSQFFHTRKLGKILVLYAVLPMLSFSLKPLLQNTGKYWNKGSYDLYKIIIFLNYPPPWKNSIYALWDVLRSKRKHVLEWYSATAWSIAVNACELPAVI